jgi:hypothetical protein
VFSLGEVAGNMQTKTPDFFFYSFGNFRIMTLIFILPLIAILPDILYKFLRKIYYLEPVEIIKKLEYDRE